MDTLVIQLINSKAYKLIQDMEDMKLIRVIKQPMKMSSLPGKIRTRMSDDDIDKQLKAIRKEWQRDT
jgi:hypothetical protein